MPKKDGTVSKAFTNKPMEIALNAEQSYVDIFNEVEVDVVFEDEGGSSWRVPAFWAGDNTYRARFAAPEPGCYTWRSECSNPGDGGFHGQTGHLEAVPYDGPCDLYRHGRIRTSDSKCTLEHADGTPFLWLADTWWMGLTTRLDWPDGFRRLVEDRVRKGFNTIQIVAGPLPDFCATEAIWVPQQANEAGWPWEEEFARINPAFYDLADLRLAFLVEQGLMPCVVGMWGYYLPFMGVERCKKHWRNLLARYGSYPVVWCLCGECTMPTYAHHGAPEGERDRETQREGWTDVARYVRDIDPYENLLTAHPGWGVPGRQSIKDESLVDFDMLQTGHGGYLDLGNSVQAMRDAVDREPRIPALNGEACYEGIMGGSKDEIQRFLFWTSMLGGACGHTYGAQGIWAMSSRDEPFQGTTRSWGDGFWQDVMHYPGSTHVGMGAKVLRRYDWWRLRPSGRTESDDSECSFEFAARIPGELVVIYLPANCIPPELRGDQSKATVGIEPGTRYQAQYINPRTGEVKPRADVTPQNGRWGPPPKPTKEDWVLVLEATA
ncbi:MAG: DUF4038 domain-containing protein [Planctomycetes bacterium]|nr:DUF4038 domain-containing protein [Planctomycetota bacterium]